VKTKNETKLKTAAAGPVPVVLNGTAVVADPVRVGRVAAVRARVRAGVVRTRAGLRTWVLVTDVDDETLAGQATADAARRRKARVEAAARAVRVSAERDAREAVVESVRTADARREHAAAVAVTAEDTLPAVDVRRVRVRRRVVRGLLVAAGGYGIAVTAVTAPLLLLLGVPASLVGLWVAGRDGVPAATDDTTTTTAAGGVVPVGEDLVLGEATPVPMDRAAWVLDALAACGIQGGRVLTVSHRPWGVTIDVELPRGGGVLAERLGDVEGAMRLRVGGLSYQVNPLDAGVITLRARTADPWAGLGAPRHHRPLSLSVRQPLPIGLDMDGGTTSIGLCRTHTVLVGGSGSGKSSALWTVIDALSACRDTVIVGIDLTGAPALMAWGDVIQTLATTEKDAERLLTRLVGQARGRSTDLGERSRPRVGEPLPDITSENWEPSEDGPQIVLVIDEYPTVVEAGLWPWVSTYLKIARKGAMTLVLASQRATKSEMGSSTVAAQIGLRGLLACDVQDTQLLLGPGMRAKGWTPDRLQPAQGDDPADAGVVYLYGGAHVSPVPKKFARLTLGEVHRRAIERMEAGLPRIDAATVAYGDAAELAARSAKEDKRAGKAGDEDGFDGDGDDDPVEVELLTPTQVTLLRTVLTAMGDAPRAHLRDLAATLADTLDMYEGLTAGDLGARLRDADVTVRAKLRIDGAVTAGVRREDIEWRLRDDETRR
jgi:hypothetical protein